MSRGDALDDGRPTAADDRAWRAAVRRQDRLYAQAYDAGVAGAAWEPDAWPDDPMVWEAYDTGVVERRRRRRDRRWALAVAALRWTGRHLAPRTARRVRRAGRRWRRLRRTGARSLGTLALGAVALVVLAAALAVAGCGLDSGGGDSGTSDRCLRAMLDETAVVERQYRAGTLTGADRAFLDKHGVQVAVIVAEHRVRADMPECDELWGPPPTGDP